jgi:serine phosphatase RsbU (regulator of sigma subunit)/anti-sigma regulatory factor (Ser/Thr protein kinase)
MDAERGRPLEDILAEERAILGEIVSRAPAAIALLWGPEHRIRLVNDRWRETFPGGEALGRTIAEAVPEASVVAPLADRVFTTGEPLRGTDMPFPAGGPPALGGYRYFTFTMSPVPGAAGGCGGVLVLGVETTAEVRRRRDLERELAAERGIADVLQRSLLPAGLPELPGLALAARYVPGVGAQVGGDWYDVISLGGDRVGLAIGDVTGCGVEAASAMGQLRHALRGYALEGHPPAGVLERLDHLLEHQDQMATALYAVLEVSTGCLVFASAGHPPALVVAGDGPAAYLSGPRHAPLGTRLTSTYEQSATTLAPGATLLLYTDGLVEERGRPIQDGLERLREAAGRGPADPELLCDQILATMQPGGSGHDDAALLVLRTVPLSPDRFRLQFPARPAVLSMLRPMLRRWLDDAGASPDEAHEIVIACNEACTNAIEHAYALASGGLEVEAANQGGEITIAVRDRGRWRPPRGLHRGHGLVLIRALIDDLRVERTARGTEVHLRRRLGPRAGG